MRNSRSLWRPLFRDNLAPRGILRVGFIYDYENRLVGTSLGCNFTYAPTGERITSKCNGVTTYYGYDFAGRGAGNLIATYNGTTFARMQRFTHADRVDSPVELYAGGTHYAYEVDALGSVKRITSASGGTVNSYTYDAWGSPTQTGTLANPFEFTAREWDSADSLYYFRARPYDPSSNTGHRFMQTDKGGCAASGTRVYAYVGDNPTNRKDPTGHDFMTCFGECLLGDCFCTLLEFAGLGTSGVECAPSPPTWCDLAAATCAVCYLSAVSGFAALYPIVWIADCTACVELVGVALLYNCYNGCSGGTYYPLVAEYRGGGANGGHIIAE